MGKVYFSHFLFRVLIFPLPVSAAPANAILIAETERWSATIGRTSVPRHEWQQPQITIC